MTGCAHCGGRMGDQEVLHRVWCPMGHLGEPFDETGLSTADLEALGLCVSGRDGTIEHCAVHHDWVDTHCAEHLQEHPDCATQVCVWCLGEI